MSDVINNPRSSELLTDKEILSKIWFSPRKVFKFINDNQYDKHVKLLLVLAGISAAFDRAVLKDIGDTFSLLGVMGMSIIAGGLLGWINYYIYAALIRWTGKWLGGAGNTKSILRVLSYATIPIAFALLCLIPQIGIYGNEMFKSNGDIISAGTLANIFVFGSFFIEFILTIWTLVLCIVAISEVQRLSIWKAMLNAILAVFVIIVLIIAIASLFDLTK